MSQCTRQKLSAEQITPLLNYVTDALSHLLQLYLRDFHAPEITVSGLERLLFSTPILKEPAVLDPCGAKSRFRVKNMELTVTAPDAAINVDGYFSKEPIILLLRKVSLEVETDCRSHFTINEMMVGEIEFQQPGPATSVGIALRNIPRLLWYIRNGLRTTVIGQTFVLPVRAGADAIPLLCS